MLFILVSVSMSKIQSGPEKTMAESSASPNCLAQDMLWSQGLYIPLEYPHTSVHSIISGPLRRVGMSGDVWEGPWMESRS